MKKKITVLCAVAAMGIAAAAGVSLQNRAQLSDVALANIEALADEEGDDEEISDIVDFPCTPDPGKDCTFKARFTDGSIREASVKDYRKTGL